MDRASRTMKPYDKSNSFMGRFTKRVSEYLPGMAWINTLIGDEQTDDNPTSTTENDDQPPVKKLCTSNNSFTNTKYEHKNSTDNHRSSNVNVLLPEISAITCIPSTSKQSPTFTSQSSASLQNYDVDNRNIKRLLNLYKLSTSNEFLMPTSSKQINPRKNESHQQSSIKCHETSTNHVSPASFRWDTFFNYGELSELQKLIVQKSPLNCSQVMYGGSSGRSNLSKILGNTPPIHRKTVIPISPSNDSEIRTTSSIFLRHISSKNKEIEEKKCTIQNNEHQRHKSDQKNVPIEVESTVKMFETTTEKADKKSSEILSTYSSQVDAITTRKLRVNLSKKRLGLNSDELEMPAEVNLPGISLPLTALPRINLSNTFTEDNK